MAVSLGVFFASVLLAACGSKPGEVTRATLTLRQASDTACQLTDLRTLRVTALGDFPTNDLTVGILDLERGASVFDTFPLATRALRVESDVSFGGTRFLSDESSSDVLLLPLSRMCRASDEAVMGLTGAALVSLPDGGMLAIGGSIDDIAQRSVMRLSPGAARPELLEVNDALFTKRAFASATVSGDMVVVVGGDGRAADAPEDSIEFYNLATRRFDRESRPTTFLREGRSHHAALRLVDGRILIAGGNGASGLLATSEILDPETGEVDTSVGALPSARRGMLLTRLADGTILAVGGEVANGPTSYRAVGDILAFDLASGAYSALGPGLSFPPRLGAAIAPLVGDRVAYVGGVDASATFVDAVDVLHVHGEPHIERVPFTNASCVGGVFCRALRDISATSLLDGRLLVAATDAQNGSARAYLLDFNRNTVIEIAMANAASGVAVLADGTEVFLSREGVYLRRDTFSTRYDNPSTLIAGTMEGIALDTLTHWQVAGNAVAAMADARLDIPLLRFADVDIELAADGDAELLLLGEGDTDSISVRSDQVGFALCHATRVDGSVATISRRSDAITFSGGGDAVTCASSGGLGRDIGIALTAHPSTVLRSLRLLRVAQ